MRSRNFKIGVAIALAFAVVLGGVIAARSLIKPGRNYVTAYFANTNGLFTGDEVRILGVPVGAVETIQPEPNRAKVTFWVKSKYKLPADVQAAIISPQVVTARAIQLTPVYTGGPTLPKGATLEENRTAVPLEWDDLRVQLQKLTDALQPSTPGGVNTLGAFVNTAADNLRGQGVNIHDAVVNMSKAFSAIGDHSEDTFATIKNLSLVVSALHDSSALLAQLNGNLATVSGLLTESPGAAGNAIKDLNDVVGDAGKFIADNREVLGTSVDKLASITKTVNDNRDSVAQSLHVFPNLAANFNNVYQPQAGAIAGILAPANAAELVTFLCGGIESSGIKGSDISSRLCVQYLSPIMKNRRYNTFPLGENLFVGTAARPNELSYSEDRLRPDFVPPQSAPPGPAVPVDPMASADPNGGLPGMMLPAEGGR